MPKSIKCSQCKYLKEFGVISETEGSCNSFWCKADKSLELDENNIKQFRDCSLFRNRTKTAWQEVKEDIIKRIPKMLKFIMDKIFKK